MIRLALALIALMTPTERYVQAAFSAGCPRDQVENFVRAGIVLQRQQLAASAAARLCDREGGPTKIGYGGARGGGKSHWGIAQVICDDCVRFPGLKFLYLRKVGKAGKEAVQDLRREVLHGTPHEYKSQDGIILLPNGSRVVLGHFQNDRDIDSYLGLQYDGALVEEATQLTSRKIKDIGTCVRSAKPGWRPRMYFTTNPGNIGHAWFKALFIDPMRRGTEAATRFVQATVRDNAFVNADYRQELEGLTGWQRRAWLDGDWDIAAGQYFTTFQRIVHGIPAIPQVPEGWRTWSSLDYGFVHYTASYLFAQSGDGDVYAVGEHAERGWLVERNANAMKAMFGRFGVPVHRLEKIVAGTDVFAKKQNGGTIADDYKSHGLTLSTANIDRINGAAEILRRLGDVEAKPDPIRPTLFITENCPRLLDCIPSLQHDDSRPEDVLKVDCDADGLGGDDFYDAFRYGVMVAANSRKWKIS
ncbi:phage terminase large subunit [Singulisphaera sp. PoT]|uniref:phage terminase large subunit n=1 Tax=Singulisphaera sp. PoT TaxID=3411797 RepID=UPI003BF580AC